MSSVTEFMNQDSNKDDDKLCDLSLKQRYIAGGICMGIGILFSFLSFICFASGDLATFAIIYSIGTVAAVAGSFFIAGPKTHIKAFKIVAHIVSSAVLVGAIIMVFVSALAIDSTALAVIFVIVELVALIFFSLTLKELTWKAAKAFITKIFTCCK